MTGVSARTVALSLTAATIVCCALAADAPNLVTNGDFELDSPDSPPPGWTMWGAQQYKDPANYTRDTRDPHRGDASFRIHHPADTRGYIVSAPDSAIRPRRGMMYEISFWARSDRPAGSLFQITAYETIAPYRDAPAPGRWALDVEPEWRPFRFAIREGWDFFADRSRYLLLTFNATDRPEEERTLWVDDVVVTEAPVDREGRMIDESTLEIEPLPHRLREGERLAFTVDAHRRLGPAVAGAGGISFHRVAGWTGQPFNREGDYTLDPEVEDAIRELRLPMTRFYAVGDEPFGANAAIDKAAAVLAKVGIPQEDTVLELETQGATSGIAAADWGSAVRHSVEQGYGFRYWEVCNEPYLTRPESAYQTPDEYVAHLQEVAAAVRAAQPEAQIGVAISSYSVPWGNYVLKRAAGSYDFVVAHYYCAAREIGRRKFEAVVLTENYKTLHRVLQVGALASAYNPDREVYQLDTEWGMHSSGPNGERADYVDRNANILGTLHRAVRLIYYAREGMLRGASSWQMLNRVGAQGFGILTQEQPDKRFMLYWLYYYFNRHVGQWALELDGTAPYYSAAEGDDPHTRPGEFAGPLTPALATLSEDGRTLYLMIANGSWDREVPCEVRMESFTPAAAEAVLLSHSDPDGKPLLERKEDFVHDFTVFVQGQELSCSLPPHSVVFVRVEGE